MSVRIWTTGYCVLTAAAVFLGRDVIAAIPYIHNLFQKVMFCVLGPFAVASYTTIGQWTWPLTHLYVLWFGVLLYILTTLLLAGCLALSIKGTEPFRVIGYVAFGIVWMVSGFVTLISRT
jgi:hypothetical protein